MIKRLRLKFICVIMSIVTLMLGGILGVVIWFTSQGMQLQSVNMMRTIASSPFQLGSLEKPSEEVRLPFFIVQISSRGELLTASGGYFDLSDREYLQQIINAALRSEKETGKLEAHNLRYLKSTSPAGLTIVFSDTTTEEATLKNLLLSCLMIFLVALVIFLGISILLSHWVIKPVATAWNQQRQFVADASHELKTPLSVIMANAELIHSDDTSESDRRRFSKNILDTTYQMRSLVENMLEMARVDNGTLKMPLGPVDLSQLVQDAVFSFQLLYEEQGLGLEWDIPEEIRINGNEQHLYQVMDVLLDNALKYSTPGGTVRVLLGRSGRSCTLAVSSPGEAISPADLKNIFKRFYRADKARAMNGSYGLGLSIAESVILAHRGRIWAESREGTNTFHITLPLTPGSNGVPL